MLNASALSLAHGPKVLFDQIVFTINRGERIGLVGANGSGKTTLLRIIAGQDVGQEGGIETTGEVRVGYLPQDGIEPGPASLLCECEEAFPEVLADWRELKDLEEKLAAAQDSEGSMTWVDRIAEVEERLRMAGADRIRGKIQRVLKGLGFTEGDLDRPARTFSGGWRMRIALARLILEEPDLLLLDEPTNHLDIDTQEWLEGLLSAYTGSILIVSHDRGFLDRVTNRTFHLCRGKLDTYEGNYSFFETAAAEKRAQQEKQAAKQSKEIERVERFIERFRAKATKARQVQSRIKALEKIERIDLDEAEGKAIAIRFPPPPRGPQRLVQLEGVAQRYGDLEVFRGVDIEIERGEKLALVGRNGRGKSTLARLVAGIEPPAAGVRRTGDGTVISWFAQHQAEELDPTLTVQSCAESAAHSGNRDTVRGLLGAFLFSGDDVYKPVRVLSGGEKNRLALVRMLLRPANLLVLDEPTNHLDMASKTRLQAALMEYEGAVLIVAHDRDFLDPIIDRVIAFEHEGLQDFPGDLSSYLWHRSETEEEPGRANRGVESSTARRERDGETPKERRKREAEERARLAPIRRKLKTLEDLVAQLETSIAEAESAMADPAFFDGSDRMAEALSRYEAEKRRLARSMEEWEELVAAIPEG